MLSQDAISRLNNIHQHIYKYVLDPNVEVFGSTDIKIICETHGVFSQKLHDHLYNKSKCPRCVNEHRRSKFVERAVEKYGSRYDYSQVSYTNNYTPVEIICCKHGNFYQVPTVHLKSTVGCPLCKTEQRTSSVSTFVKQAQIIHDNKYDYTNVVYKTCKQKVDIICSKHGTFKQTPDNHLRGSGCPKCAGDTLRGKYVAGYNTSPDKPGILYVLSFVSNTERFIKIGITSRKNPNYRFGNNHAGYTITRLFDYKLPIKKANKLEKILLSTLNEYRYIPNNKFGGYTECVQIDSQYLHNLIQEQIHKYSEEDK